MISFRQADLFRALRSTYVLTLTWDKDSGKLAFQEIRRTGQPIKLTKEEMRDISNKLDDAFKGAGFQGDHNILQTPQALKWQGPWVALDRLKAEILKAFPGAQITYWPTQITFGKFNCEFKL